MGSEPKSRKHLLVTHAVLLPDIHCASYISWCQQLNLLSKASERQLWEREKEDNFGRDECDKIINNSAQNYQQAESGLAKEVPCKESSAS